MIEAKENELQDAEEDLLLLEKRLWEVRSQLAKFDQLKKNLPEELSLQFKKEFSEVIKI